MHICFLCHEYPPGKGGGIGSFTQTIGRALAQRGHRITVLGIYPSHYARIENDQGVRIIRIPGTRVPRMGFLINGIRLQRVLYHLYEKEGIDLLEGPNSSLALIPKSFPAPKVMRFHGGHRFFSITIGEKPHFWRSLMESLSVRHADFLCSVSRYNAEVNRLLLRLGSRPIEVIYNPVDTDFFSPKPGVKEDKGLIVYLGTLCKKKGVYQLIQAIPKVLRTVPETRLWLVGRDWKDPKTGKSYMSYLCTLIPTDLTDRIIFKGPVEHDEVPNVLAQAQICVFPSLMEAHPVAWVEALSMGKAIVASKTGPGPEVIQDGVSGLLCNPYDPDSIAEKILCLLWNEELREQIKKEARHQAVERFSISPITEQNESFYQRCIQQWSNNC